ncbi:hypothetical protein JIN85_17290 [Luteolibacter pohnpeiensis]|uniref:Uncharacterized protein n=1 Tax=Luteolibacter pohnpeiensis TaxID=454153 RepID=A0A934S8M8_9BACT|nr:hypothetical protein [Luteolibacter pohnpeiensis]MBK1884177.1 hypothetical protein [Luteolibacter pohnpeiensis]
MTTGGAGTLKAGGIPMAVTTSDDIVTNETATVVDDPALTKNPKITFGYKELTTETNDGTITRYKKKFTVEYGAKWGYFSNP